jgi:hypothetical protein
MIELAIAVTLGVISIALLVVCGGATFLVVMEIIEFIERRRDSTREKR